MRTRRPITKLLVANRGEIARRVIRTAHDMGIATVAVYTRDDAFAPFVADACEAVPLASDSYLDQASVLEAAAVFGADAVHPGYGFLSENAAFASAVIERKLIWVGPHPEAIATMGDKLAAKALAGAVGVPTLPMAEDPVDADAVGFPLLVKAAAGGGGKGMRVVPNAEQLSESIAAARREAAAAFGDDRVFLERYVARSRHIEIQVLGDTQGNLVHLGERECSIQRRHQKIIEEAPSTVLDNDLRERMGDAALRLAKALNYHSLGTVEFLVDDDVRVGAREFWFLEVNTRLQVEHPVTEAVTGLDLVREQIQVAEGSRIEFSQSDIAMSGHAIEARLYAEDPAAGFLPAAGVLHRFEPSRGAGLRYDSGVQSGSSIGTRFDPMVAKVIAWAPTRTEAAMKLALALERTRIAGVTTNRDFLVATLRTDEFLAGDTTTDFIDRVGPARHRVVSSDAVHRAAIAAALWLDGERGSHEVLLSHLPATWRNSRIPSDRVAFGHGPDTDVGIGWRLQRDGTFALESGDIAHRLGWTADAIDLELAGRRLRATISAFDDVVVVHAPDGDVRLTLRPRFPIADHAGPSGGLNAPMPGSITAIRVEEGAEVEAGQLLMILEAMKMEHHITAPHTGVVTGLRVALGDHVDNGTLLLVLEAT